jgi:hypothetical protein
VHPVVNCNATASSHLPAGAAWLIAKHYKIFLIQIRCCFIKQWSQLTCIIGGAENGVPGHEHTLYCLNRVKLTSWIRTPALIIFGEKKGSASPSWTDCKCQLQKLTLLAVLCGCKVRTTASLYGWSLSSFVAVAADDFEMPVSYVRHFSDFCGVHFNPAPISYSFFSVSMRCFLAGFLPRSDAVDLTFKIHGCLLCMELCSQKIYNEIF